MCISSFTHSIPVTWDGLQLLFPSLQLCTNSHLHTGSFSHPLAKPLALKLQHYCSTRFLEFAFQTLSGPCSEGPQTLWKVYHGCNEILEQRIGVQTCSCIPFMLDVLLFLFFFNAKITSCATGWKEGFGVPWKAAFPGMDDLTSEWICSVAMSGSEDLRKEGPHSPSTQQGKQQNSGKYLNLDCQQARVSSFSISSYPAITLYTNVSQLLSLNSLFPS